MEEIRQLPAVDKRVETGPVQFGDDRPGTFIRGDNAAYYAMLLKAKLEDRSNPLYDQILWGLLDDLQGSNLMSR